MSSLRPIDVAGFRPVAPAIDHAAPQLQWIAIENLVIDDDYQREITSDRKTAILKIADNFHWNFFSTVMVSPIVGGQYAIIDGQGRTIVAKLCGITSVPCAVIIADKKEQARAFAAVNGSVVIVRPLQRFKALVAAGDPEAMKVKTIADRAGVSIAASSGGKQHAGAQPTETFALEAIRRAIKRHGDQTTEIALRACAKSCTAKGGHIRSDMIAAVARVLDDEPRWRAAPDLDETFSAIALDQLWRDAVADSHKNANCTPRDMLCGILIGVLAERYDGADA